MSHLIDCSHCKGSGRVELTGVYAKTLGLLRESGSEITAAKLSIIANCAPTAMNNRLAALERFGLAESRREGKRRFYRVKK